ncbi:unnamed protein product [Cochlearia groenlandica]
MANPRRVISPLINILKKPQAIPLLLTFFLFLTWISLRLQHPKSEPKPRPDLMKIKYDDDDGMVNLVRFDASSLSPVRKDDRGWLLDPIIFARHSLLYGSSSLSLFLSIQIHRLLSLTLSSGGADSCVSIHVGEIRPGGLRGNHRHHTCNETFVLWGAKTRFRLENHKVKKGFAEVVIGEEQVAVAVSPSGTAHALINVDTVRSTFFIGCQDSSNMHNSSSSDYKVWNDL